MSVKVGNTVRFEDLKGIKYTIYYPEHICIRSWLRILSPRTFKEKFGLYYILEEGF